MPAVPPMPPAVQAERYVFVLLPRCSMMALGSAIDVLTQANQASLEAGGGPLYDVQLASVDGRPVSVAGGAVVAVDRSIATLRELPAPDAAIVVSDTPLPQIGFDAVCAALHDWARQTRWIGGIGTGAWLLARAGLLKGHRATLHWAYVPLFAQDFPDTVVSSNVFEAADGRFTCAGGYAAFDMMLHRVAQTHGADIAQQLLSGFSLEHPRGIGEPQRVPLAARIGGGQPKLTEAVALMEANIEEPLGTEEIARLVGVSRRQLERLFKQYLDSLPSRYYLEMRVTRARRLLQQTSQSVLQIGLACGFSSGPHFSNTYRARFGLTPREQRSQRAATELDTPAPSESP